MVAWTDGCVHIGFNNLHLPFIHVVLPLWLRLGKETANHVRHAPPPPPFPWPSIPHRNPSRINQILLLPIRLHLLPLLRVIPRILIASPSLPLPTPLVKLIQDLLRNPIQQLLRINPQQIPRQIDGLINRPRLVRRLRDKSALKLVQKLERELVFRAQSFLADDGFHAGGIAADGVFSVELVRDVAVVFAGVAFADGRFHEAGEGGEDVDRGVDTFVVKLAVDEDLAFGDVSCEVGDRVGDIYNITYKRGAFGEGGLSNIPSLGIVRMGIWVIDPLRPSTRPARSYIVDKSVYI